MEDSVEKGGDLLVRVNGAVLGGVKELKRSVKNEPYEIHQFLTDKPVARLVRKTYELEFDLRCGEACPFEDDIVSISVKDRQKTEIYTLCAVKKLGSSAHRTGDVEYHAVVSAEERSVLFE